ncbi:MAG TPA: glycosyltransferase family 2 protein [Pirellulales bacterium]|nr:glycosyltransferase family 2 protein [Pirellulales bacterium]
MTTAAQQAGPRPTISVALCTYNGERFLSQQLASLAGQSCKPDELVVVDDGSTDASLAILRDFADAAPFQVMLHSLQQNVGSRDAFSQCIAACRGDLIFLCDQDDVWLPDKLERLSNALASEPDAAFAFSDALLVDDSLQPLPGSLWQRVGLRSKWQSAFCRGRGFELLLKRPLVTGATMAFRSHHRPLLLPIPQGWVHDAWISLLLSAVSRGLAVPRRLLKYRLHSDQQIGVEPRTWRERARRAMSRTADDYRTVALGALAAAERLESFAGVGAPRIAALRRKAKHFDRRAECVASGPRGWPSVAGELLRGNYHRFSLGFTSAGKDCLSTFL